MTWEIQSLTRPSFPPTGPPLCSAKAVLAPPEETDPFGILATGARKDRTVIGVACEGSYFAPFCCSQPDGTGADIGSDERWELTTRETIGIIGIWFGPMNDDYA